MKVLKNVVGFIFTFALLVPSVALADVNLVGSGASFPAPLYTTWFKTFSRENSGVQVSYQSKGSGAGIRDFQNHVVDFGASDAAMSAEEISKVAEGVQLLPMTAGEIVLSYNLKGVKELKLPREAYSKIYLGEITKWNDPIIAKANPGVKLPDENITVVARADSSGTTFNFTQHLAAINKEFKDKVGSGKTVDWPLGDHLVKSPKNDGVAATIMQTPGAIGYIEFGYAKMTKLPMASLENKAGKFVAPGLAGGQAALANVTLPENMIVFVTDPEGADSYPMVTYTWMLFYKTYQDKEKLEWIHKLIDYCLFKGQAISDKAGYIPLPETVVKKVSEAAKTIQ
ncbi:phosphate ABC transporter substrate-binding protein PstS [Desulfovibrio inopinatus]|uniref:phosphate ABC transporter substrate-binding protein PstS n=1 Tax=Desulfovibrio inopinatus TaxID=102109 RepID=UPI0004111FC1|nr:phosphate ABC transporter substrate-binding protein PstS [Desulfovibrio inopinatus]